MLVSTKKMKDVEEFMKKLDEDMRERKVTDFRIARLRRDIRLMSKDRESVERSKNTKRIGLFNRLFISKLAELSRLMQTHGSTNRDDIANMVRAAKAK